MSSVSPTASINSSSVKALGKGTNFRYNGFGHVFSGPNVPSNLKNTTVIFPRANSPKGTTFFKYLGQTFQVNPVIIGMNGSKPIINSTSAQAAGLANKAIRNPFIRLFNPKKLAQAYGVLAKLAAKA